MPTVPGALEVVQRVVPDDVVGAFPDVFARNRDGARFFNPWPHAPFPGLLDVLRWKLRRNPLRPWFYRAPPVACAPAPLAAFDTLRGHDARILWIGHASFLVDMDDTRLVIDPIFGRAAVVMGRVTKAALQASELGHVQAVLVTHGHHDHLDKSSLRAIAKSRPGQVIFVVPEGLGRALPSECRPYVELPWWTGTRIGNVRVWCVPAQHWHRRSAFDHNRSGWGGFVIEGSQRVYHSGDTGYFEGFRAIARVFDGIDAACLPLGAYEPTWFMSAQHMSPRDSLNAFDDLGARTFIGMHWGAFDQSNEPILAGPEALARMVREEARDPTRFAVLAPGGSVGLSRATTAEVLHRHVGSATPPARTPRATSEGEP